MSEPTCEGFLVDQGCDHCLTKAGIGEEVADAVGMLAMYARVPDIRKTEYLALGRWLEAVRVCGGYHTFAEVVIALDRDQVRLLFGGVPGRVLASGRARIAWRAAAAALGRIAPFDAERVAGS